MCVINLIILLALRSTVHRRKKVRARIVRTRVRVLH